MYIGGIQSIVVVSF